MQITCRNCGSDRFKAGYIEQDTYGGYTVMMPCSNCGQPYPTMHAYDPELAKELLEFFNEPEEKTG